MSTSPPIVPALSQGGTITGQLNLASTTSIVPPLAVDSLSQLGIVAWNYPSIYGTAVTPALTSGTVYTMLVPLTGASTTFSNVLVAVGTGGSTLTSGENFIGVYAPSGTQIGVSADQTTPWATAGLKTAALVGAPFTGSFQFVVVALVANGTTCPQFERAAGANSGVGIVNLNATGAALPCASNGTGATTLPGSLTYSSATGSGGQSIWVGLS